MGVRRGEGGVVRAKGCADGLCSARTCQEPDDVASASGALPRCVRVMHVSRTMEEGHMHDAPRYKALKFCAVHGIPYKVGEVVGGVVGHTLWPVRWLEPINEGAKRIVAYYAKHKDNR